jgi:hypothetical protein
MRRVNHVQVKCPECGQTNVIKFARDPWPKTIQIPDPPPKLAVKIESCDRCGQYYDASEAQKTAILTGVTTLYPQIAKPLKERGTLSVEKTIVHQTMIKGRLRFVRIDILYRRGIIPEYFARVFIETGSMRRSGKAIHVRMSLNNLQQTGSTTVGEALRKARTLFPPEKDSLSGISP